MIAASQGRSISYEGIDGAGKTTHIGTLAEAFARHGRRVLRTREPGGTALAEKLRALVLHEPMGALTEALLVFAARCDHVHQVILPSLALVDVVLCDRFADATFAYQGAGRNFDWSTLLELESMVLRQDDGQPLQPDLTLWFDVPPAIAAQRLADARQPDKFEAESTKFFERVAAGYARRMQEAPARFARIDASCTPEQVWQQVVAVMEQKGWLA